MPGFPIRTSSDHSSVDSSPRLIAASYVLHRLLMPRHPPCALNNLATKMLASTVQFSKYGQDHAVEPTAYPEPARSRACGRPVRRRPVNSLTSRDTHNNQALVPSGPNSVPRSQPQTDHDVPRFHQGSSTCPTGPRPTTRCQRSTHMSNHSGTVSKGHSKPRSWP